jgi:hypothetical protein
VAYGVGIEEGSRKSGGEKGLPHALAESLYSVATTPSLWQRYAGDGKKRVRDFSQASYLRRYRTHGGMLTTQAHTLDLIFNNLLAAPLPTCKRDTCPPQKPTCGCALKAQSQSRATIETLAEIKNPRQVAFVKQANIAGGNQQIHSGAEPTRARENEIPPSKQSGYEHELSPDRQSIGAWEPS